jgi:hypothetical protein
MTRSILLLLLRLNRFREIIPEEYVYIMETDHLLLQDLPNLAPDKDTVAGFYFPYMDPTPPDIAKVVRRFYKEGPVSDLYATGPSPTLLHVDVLKRIVQLWCAPARTATQKETVWGNKWIGK